MHFHYCKELSCLLNVVNRSTNRIQLHFTSSQSTSIFRNGSSVRYSKLRCAASVFNITVISSVQTNQEIHILCIENFHCKQPLLLLVLFFLPSSEIYIYYEWKMLYTQVAFHFCLAGVIEFDSESSISATFFRCQFHINKKLE